MNLPDRPITVLIAALGGEGGGVLADWIVAAATAQDYPVQSTSIPGVAQRTGATTYYIEIYQAKTSGLGGRRPVMTLTPAPGLVDVMVASELLEAGRAMQNGYVTERTTLVASTHRVYTVAEKMQMGEARHPLRHAGQSERSGHGDQRGDVRGAGRLGNAAALARRLRGVDPLGRQGRRGEPQGICRRLRRRRGWQSRHDARGRQALAWLAGGTAEADLSRGNPRHPARRRGALRRFPGPRIRQRLSRPDRADREPRPRRRRLQADHRDRALPRAVDVLRGRDPRRRPEDAQEPLRARTRGSAGEAARAGARYRIPQAGPGRARRGAAALARPPAQGPRRNDRTREQAQRRHARQNDERERVPHDAFPRLAAAAAAAHRALARGTGADRPLARCDRGRGKARRGPRPRDRLVRTFGQGLRRNAQARQRQFPAHPRLAGRGRCSRRSASARGGDPQGARGRARRPGGTQARSVAGKPRRRAAAAHAEAGAVHAPQTRRPESGVIRFYR